MVIILLPAALEVETEVEDRLRESALRAEEQRNQQSPESAVAAEKRVDGFELHVREPCLDERGCLCRIAVQEFLEGPHALDDAVGRRRNKASSLWTRTTDPYLAAAELARHLAPPTVTAEEYRVDLTQQPHR